jgi:chaperonin cofactor prefoldin
MRRLQVNLLLLSPSYKTMNEEIIKKIESQEKTIEMLCKRIDIAHERIDAIREMVENLKKQ